MAWHCEVPYLAGDQHLLLMSHSDRSLVSLRSWIYLDIAIGASDFANLSRRPHSLTIEYWRTLRCVLTMQVAIATRDLAAREEAHGLLRVALKELARGKGTQASTCHHDGFTRGVTEIMQLERQWEHGEGGITLELQKWLWREKCT